jgi:hypothetical protein
MAKTYFGHPRRGVRVKTRLRAIAKLTFGISLGVASNLIPTRKTEIFWEPQKGTVHPPPGGSVQKTHQAFYLSDLIRVNQGST